MYDQQKTWSEARDICLSDGSSLPVPWNRATNEIIQDLIPGDRTFLGMSDIDKEGSWVTVHGSPLGFTNWDEHEPNNADNNEDCGFMFKESGKWNDRSCSSLVTFICQFKQGAN